MPSKLRFALRVVTTLALFALLASIIMRRIKTPPLDDTPQLSHQSVSKGIGVSLGLFASDPLWDYQEFLQELSSLGVKRLMIVVPLKLSDHKSSALWLGISLNTLERTARQARSLNMSLTLMPVIQLEKRSMKIWRGMLAPQDLDAWWSNYHSDLTRLADLAEREQFERLVIGSELCSLEDQSERWMVLINSLRRRFKGKLTYSANWDHYQEVPFWSLLDEVSMTAYFPVTSIETFEGEWLAKLHEMEQFTQQQNRPLIITEYGYPALQSALREPWNETTQAPFDPILQGNLVSRSTALLKKHIDQHLTLAPKEKKDGLRGAFLWNWFGFGGLKDRGFTLRGRIGQTQLKKVL